MSVLERVSALVVSHNSASTLRECLEPLAGQLQVVVVDSDSQDDSAAIAASIPGIESIPAGRNLGLGAGSNAAASRARGEFLLLLNPDCIAAPEAVATMAQSLADTPTLGFVGPKIRMQSGALDHACLRGDPDPVGSLLYLTGVARLFPASPRVSRYSLTHLDVDREQPLLNGTAACLLVRASAFHAVGGFDERYFMYGEDLDLCRGLREAGHPGLYLPSAEVLHVKGESTRQRSGAMLVEFHRAMWLYYLKHEAARRPGLVNAAVGLGITALGTLRLAVNTLRTEQRVSAR